MLKRLSSFFAAILVTGSVALAQTNTVPISGLPPAFTPLVGSEMVPIVQNSITRQTPVSNIIGSSALDGVYGNTPGSMLARGATGWQTISGTAGQIPISQGGAIPAFLSMSGDCTLASAGAITCTKTGGVPFYKQTSISTTYSALATDRDIVITSVPSSFAVTLPAANSVPAGYTIRVIDSAFAASLTNVVTVQPAGADTMAGGSFKMNVPGMVLSLQSNGSNSWANVGVSEYNFLQAGTGATRRSFQSKLRDVVSILDFGAVGDGATDDTAAIQAALTYAASVGGGIYLPPLKYRLNSGLSVTIPNGKSLGIYGSGSDETILYWPSGNGLSVTYGNIFSSLHVRDVSITTGSVNTGNGIALTQGTPVANSAISALSDFTHVVVRGDDGYAAAKYWAIGINNNDVSNINFDSVYMPGTNAVAGIGVQVAGNSGANNAVVFNFVNCVFNSMNVAIVYGANIQGMQITTTNMTDVNTGVSVGPSITTSPQLSITSSQINANGNGLGFASAFSGLTLSGNLFITSVASASAVQGIILNSTIVGNIFSSSTTTSTNGIVLSGGSQNVMVSGNEFSGYGVGIVVGNTASKVNIQSNLYNGNTTNTSPATTTGSVTVGGGSP